MCIARRTLAEIKSRAAKAHRELLDAFRDYDIDRMIAEDPDTAPALTEKELRQARRVRPEREKV
jgi:hypothetical protein